METHKSNGLNSLISFFGIQIRKTDNSKKNEQNGNGQGNTNLQDVKAENLIFNTYNNLPTDRKKKIDQQIYLKCDRDEMITELEDIIENKKRFPRPVIIFLPGFLEDDHNLAVKKIAFVINDHYKNAIMHLKAVDWDTDSDPSKQLRHVERSVLKAFEIYLSDKNTTIEFSAKIESGKVFSTHPFVEKHILIFEQEIDLECWNDSTYKNLCQLLQNFWNFEIDKDKNPVFIIYSLVFGKTNSLSRTEIEKITGDLQKLHPVVNNESMVIFKELSEISKGHIKTFFDNCNICDEEDFMQEGETRRMRKVLPELRKILLKRDIEADNKAVANL